MLRAIRFTISFLLSFAILSIPIGDKVLFSYIHKYASPYTQVIYNKTSSFMGDILNSGKQETKKFFTNSSPQKNKSTDSVKSSLSAAKEKKSEVESIIKSQEEKITAEEKEKLKKVLQGNL